MKRNDDGGQPSFWAIARNYLHEYMPKVRALSPKTVESYRISLECFVGYLECEQDLARADVTFDCFERGILKAWLTWMNEMRNYQPKTVNLRLTAVKSFLRYASNEDLRLVALFEGARSLKAPKAAKAPIDYLSPEQTAAILAAYDGRTAKSRRNRMLLILLYESAARVSELTSLSVADLRLAEPAHVVLTGKGNKSRAVPLTAKTAAHLIIYLDEFHPNYANGQAAGPLFSSRRQGLDCPLSVDSVALILKRAGDLARPTCPGIPDRLHCHLLRKTKAMALYTQGVPLPIIMQLLGHESASTTSAFYAFATLDMMNKALTSAMPALSHEETEWLSEEKLQMLYTLR